MVGLGREVGSALLERIAGRNRGAHPYSVIYMDIQNSRALNSALTWWISNTPTLNSQTLRL